MDDRDPWPGGRPIASTDFNQFLRDQKMLAVDEMRLSLAKFNTRCSTVYSAMVADVP